MSYDNGRGLGTWHGSETAPDVRVGQIWADNDWRSKGRTLRVDEVKHSSRMGKQVAVCTILTNADRVQAEVDRGSPWVKDRRGKTTEVGVERMKPTSTGYRLVQDVHEEAKA
jgi:hypothetical protein